MFNKNVISIDIGTYATKLVFGNYKGGKVHILHMPSIETPFNSIDDGEIVDISKMKNSINDVIINNKQFKSKKVIFTLESTEIITRELVLPYAKEEELKKILSFEVQQYFPINLEEYVIQSIKLDDFEEEGVKKSKVLVAALPKTIIKSYLELANELGLTPIALDLHSNAISKLFQCNTKALNKLNNNETLAMIDLGYENINISVIDSNFLKFNRLLTTGGKEIDFAIANALNISFEEAESIKIKNKLNENKEDVDLEIEETIRNCVNNWLNEIEKVIRFYTSRSPENKIDKIYLFGGHAKLKNVTKYFELFFEIPIEKTKNIDCIKYKNSALNNISTTPFLNAIGAIIRK